MSRPLPSTFIQSINDVSGFDKEAFINIHESGDQVTSIRFNPEKLANSFSSEVLEKVPWSSNGFYLSQRPSFTLDPLFHAGCYYVQEASSMFLEEAFIQSTDPTKQLRLLDICAAPGGKSTLIQSIISPESILVSNEIIKQRVNVLAENISKWGSPNVIVTNNEARDFQRLPGFFDVIVADAPCSGSGLFRKDPDAIDYWSTENVILCANRQKRILEDVLPSLKPGGTLIYSTCSYSKEENEDIVGWLSDKGYTSLKLQLQPSWNIVETISENNKAYGYRFYPDKLKGEGFFISVFKNDENGTTVMKPVKNDLPYLSKNEISVISPFVESPGQLDFFHWNEILAVPTACKDDLIRLKQNLYLKKAGVKIGSIKQNELIPHHELAVSTIINKEIASVDVDIETARNYLRRQEINISTNQRGWILIKYNGSNLGWVKNIGSRLNNYYPKEWRILNK